MTIGQSRQRKISGSLLSEEHELMKLSTSVGMKATISS